MHSFLYRHKVVTLVIVTFSSHLDDNHYCRECKHHIVFIVGLVVRPPTLSPLHPFTVPNVTMGGVYQGLGGLSPPP